MRATPLNLREMSFILLGLASWRTSKPRSMAGGGSSSLSWSSCSPDPVVTGSLTLLRLLEAAALAVAVRSLLVARAVDVLPAPPRPCDVDLGTDTSCEREERTGDEARLPGRELAGECVPGGAWPERTARRRRARARSWSSPPTSMTTGSVSRIDTPVCISSYCSKRSKREAKQELHSRDIHLHVQ